MAYRMMIVDDEPPFIRMLEKSLQRATDQLVMVDSANNGVEALEKISRLKPDIVFSDIKMPVMDGLDLAKEVKTLFPETIFVLVSSYRDFEYAKRAMYVGVEDYLLKPIEQSVIHELTKKMIQDLTVLRHKKAEDLFKKLIVGQSIEKGLLLEELKNRCYYLVVIKSGYFQQQELVTHENRSLRQMVLKTFEHLKREAIHYWIVTVKEDMEVTVIIDYAHVDASYLKLIILNLSKVIHSEMGLYTTMSYHTTPVTCEQMNELHKKLRSKLISQLIIGVDQQLDIEQPMVYEERKFVLEDETERKLTLLIQKGLSQGIKSALIDLFQEWEVNKYPLYGIEKLLKQILTIVEKLHSRALPMSTMNLYQQLDELLALSTSCGELLNGFWDILGGVFEEKNHKHAINLEQMIQNVEGYVKSNLADDLSLQQICDVFGVSQPYISRVFRQKMNCSYNEYVIKQRIEFAKTLIQNNRDMRLKDVSILVGYQDHHYFSRIFKKVTGVSPSEYLLNNE